LALNNPDGRFADPKYQNWSHQPITFSRAADQPLVPASSWP
jgi:hypothetical protein